METTATPNTYRVYFTLGTTTHGLRLQSSKVVQAETREAAIASVPGGTGADLLSWDDEA